MKMFVARLTAYVLVAMSSPALACTTPTERQKRRLDLWWAGEMQAAREARGTYQFDRIEYLGPNIDGFGDNGEAVDQIEIGYILNRQGRKIFETEIYISNELGICSRARHPQGPQFGRFFLERRENGRYQIRHFVPQGVSERWEQ